MGKRHHSKNGNGNSSNLKGLVAAHPAKQPQERGAVTSNNYPKENSYCKCRRATTARVIGESESGIAWKVRCDLCGSEWFENKERFAAKYIGVNGNPPQYSQRRPNMAVDGGWSDPQPKNSMGSQLESFVPAKKIAGPGEPIPAASAKHQAEKAEAVEVAAPSKAAIETAGPSKMTIQLCGVTFVIPAGSIANVKYVEGRPVVELI